MKTHVTKAAAGIRTQDLVLTKDALYQLSYSSKAVCRLRLSACRASREHQAASGHKRVMGIEPTWPAWKAGALPLSYTRSPFV